MTTRVVVGLAVLVGFGSYLAHGGGAASAANAEDASKVAPAAEALWTGKGQAIGAAAGGA